MSDCVTPRTVARRVLCPWDFPGKNTGVVAISFSRGSSQPRDRTQVSHIASRLFTVWATREDLRQWKISLPWKLWAAATKMEREEAPGSVAWMSHCSLAMTVARTVWWSDLHTEELSMRAGSSLCCFFVELWRGAEAKPVALKIRFFLSLRLYF